MPHHVDAECPKCGKKAKGYDNIEDKFGWRIINDKKKPQSHCRSCRSKRS